MLPRFCCVAAVVLACRCWASLATVTLLFYFHAVLSLSRSGPFSCLAYVTPFGRCHASLSLSGCIATAMQFTTFILPCYYHAIRPLSLVHCSEAAWPLSCSWPFTCCLATVMPFGHCRTIQPLSRCFATLILHCHCRRIGCFCAALPLSGHLATVALFTHCCATLLLTLHFRCRAVSHFLAALQLSCCLTTGTLLCYFHTALPLSHGLPLSCCLATAMPLATLTPSGMLGRC